MSLNKFTVVQLKAQLSERGAPTSGRKKDLIARLEALQAEDAMVDEDEAVSEAVSEPSAGEEEQAPSEESSPPEPSLESVHPPPAEASEPVGADAAESEPSEAEAADTDQPVVEEEESDEPPSKRPKLDSPTEASESQVVENGVPAESSEVPSTSSSDVQMEGGVGGVIGDESVSEGVSESVDSVVDSASNQASGEVDDSAGVSEGVSEGVSGSASGEGVSEGDGSTTSDAKPSEAVDVSDANMKDAEDEEEEEEEESEDEESTEPPSETEVKEMLQSLSPDRLLTFAQKIASEHLDSPHVAELAEKAAADPAKCKLFVRAIPSETTNDQMKRTFNEYGKVREAFVVRDRSGNSKGFGFVLFAKVKHAQKALKAEKIEVAGRQVFCTIATQKPARRYPQPAVNPSFRAGVQRAAYPTTAYRAYGATTYARQPYRRY